MCDRHYYNPGWQSQNHSAVRPCRSGMNSRPSQPRKRFPTAWRRTALTTELPVEHMKFRQIKLRAALAENRKPLVSRSSRLRRSFAAAAAVENPALRHFLPGNRRPASADARQNPVQVQPDAAIDHDPWGHARHLWGYIGHYKLPVTGSRPTIAVVTSPQPKSSGMNSPIPAIALGDRISMAISVHRASGGSIWYVYALAE